MYNHFMKIKKHSNIQILFMTILASFFLKKSLKFVFKFDPWTNRIINFVLAISILLFVVRIYSSRNKNHEH